MTLAPPSPGPSPTAVPGTCPTAVRVRLAVQPPHGRQARRIDGAWWPRSYDLMSELPVLLGGLPQVWGQISSVVVNGGEWSAPPGRMLVADHVVRVRRTDLPQAPPTACLLAPGRGRWDLLVVPPGASEAQARQLMADASGF